MDVPSDAELCAAAAATYAKDAQPWFRDWRDSVRVFRTTRADGLTILAIEGTHDPLGWAIDLMSVLIEDQQGLDDRSLGMVHGGFYASAVTALPRCIIAASRGPYAICGHSLGAGLALLLGALLINDDLPPVKIRAFAPPRVGGEAFIKIATSVPFCAYRFGRDIVTTLPPTLRRFPYLQVPLTELPDRRGLGPVACHNIANYVAAIPPAAA